MTIDTANGNAIVANSTSSPAAIEVYTPQGGAVASPGRFPGLSSPYGIAYDPYNDRLYVEDNAASIKVFNPQGYAVHLPGTAFPKPGYPLGVIVVP